MKIYLILLASAFVLAYYAYPSKQVASNIDTTLFRHGVASGDPLSDRVIIWTRVTPRKTTVCSVNWVVASDVAMKNIINKGTVETTQQQDYTVKVDVMRLTPNTIYYYQFETLGKKSIIGRTQTAPKTSHEPLRFGVVSCNDYQAGYFNAFGSIAKRSDLRAIIHLGDYIYEYGNKKFKKKAFYRPLSPEHEVLDLADYRMRYSLYRLDEDLVKAHQQHPFICIWDDHETANDAYKAGAQNHQPHEGNWEARKNAAKQAYFEWLPIRNHPDKKINRVLNYGDLMDLILLDTRLEGRTKQPETTVAADDSSQTMLGESQKNWFFNALKMSKAQWKIIGQQVIFSELNVGWANLFNRKKFENRALDIWDGYTVERQQIIHFIRENALQDVVFLTGDFHSALAFEVAENPTDTAFYNPTTSAGAVATEFATPSITSANFDEAAGKYLSRKVEECLHKPCKGFPFFYKKNPNPHIKYADLRQHGYYILEVTPDHVQADFYYVKTILEKNDTAHFEKALQTKTATNRLVTSSVVEKSIAFSAPAPDIPFTTDTSSWSIIGIHPKKQNQQVFVQCLVHAETSTMLHLYDDNNQKTQTFAITTQPKGIYTFHFDSAVYKQGCYKIVVGEDSDKQGYSFQL